MTAPLNRKRIALITATILSADPAVWAINPEWKGNSDSCYECGRECPTCGTSTAQMSLAFASFDWGLLVGLARYPKPTSYTDLAKIAYEKDGNLPTLHQVVRRYFPSTPLQQSQIPLKISQTKISAAIFHPSCLFIESEANFETFKKTDSGGEYIHQILTDDAFTLVEPVAATSSEGSGWRVRVWKRNAASLGTKGDEGYDASAFELTNCPKPLNDITFRHRSNAEGDNNSLVLTQKETTGLATRTTINDITQQVDANGKPTAVTSKVFDDSDHQLSEEQLVYAPRGDTPRLWDYIITRKVFTASVSADGEIGSLDTTSNSTDLTSETVETYKDISDPNNPNGGEPGMKRLISLSRSGQTTTYTYKDADNGGFYSEGTSYGRLASVSRPDGSWATYTYDGMGTAPTITEYSSWLNAAFGDTTNSRKIETEVNDTTITTRTFLGGKLVAKTLTTLSPGVGTYDPSVTTKEWDGTGAVANDDVELIPETTTTTTANILATTTVYFRDDAAEPNAGRVKSITHTDGTVDTYSYSSIPENPDNLTATVVKGSGTQVQTIYGLGNIPIAESVTDLASQLDVDSWTSEGTDNIGRPLTRSFNDDGTDYDESHYDCCGLSYFRARDGSVTTYSRDGLKRVFMVATQVGDSSRAISTRTAYNGLTTTVSRMGVFVSETTRSLDGLTTTTISASRKSNASADRLVTRTSTTSGTLESPGPVTTEEYLSGKDNEGHDIWTPTSVTRRYLDGQIHSVSGDAVTDVTYTYGTCAPDGRGILTSAKVSGISGATATYTDTLGRTVRIVSPATGETIYSYNGNSTGSGARGRLHSTTDADGVATVYGYTNGELSQTTRRVPNGTANPGYLNEMTVKSVVSGVVTAHGELEGTFKRETQTPGYGINVADSYTSLDGLTKVTKTLTGDTITSTTLPDANTGAITTTTIHPDGTTTVQTTTPAATGDTIETAHFAAGANTSLDSPVWSTTSLYDDLQRLVSVTDSRTGNAGKTEYSGFTESGTPLVTTRGGRTTTNTCDIFGRVVQSMLPDNTPNHASVACASYYPTGQVKAQWGSQTYPTFRIYNEQGQLTELRTYQSLVTEPTLNTGGFAATTWNYSASTGRLDEKHDANGKGASYTYTPAGRLKTRTWARGDITRYDYDCGYIVAIRYFANTTPEAVLSATEGNHPATPDVTITYDSLGRQNQVSNTRVTSVFTYAADLGVDTETITYTLPNQDAFTRVLDRADRSLGRDTGWTLGSENQVAYTYSATTGLLEEISNGTDVFTYGYTYSQTAADPEAEPPVPAGARVGSTGGLKQDIMPYTITKSGSPILQATRTYEASRDVLASIQNKVDTTAVSIYDYSIVNGGVNNLGQRGGVRTTFNLGGPASNPGDTSWGYDSLGQLVSADAPVNANEFTDRAYTFDTIGNRKESATGTWSLNAQQQPVFTPEIATSYFGMVTSGTPSAPGANNLNQYAAITTGAATLQPHFDDDGNMTHGPLPVSPAQTSILVWDAENRLIEVWADAETRLVSYTYDARSRRIATVIDPDDTAVTTLYIYDGFNCIAEYTGTTLSKVRTWGLDLSGSLQGAGGVGGLLVEKQGDNSFYPTYDGNGNVSEYLTGAGEVAAHFEYDPFGNAVVVSEASQGLAATFAYRFSTKPLDFLTGLYYYGYRWYDPLTGRWPSRDPIGERGGMNLYGFVGNDTVNKYDILGRDYATDAARSWGGDYDRGAKSPLSRSPFFYGRPRDGWVSYSSAFEQADGKPFSDQKLWNVLWSKPGVHHSDDPRHNPDESMPSIVKNLPENSVQAVTGSYAGATVLNRDVIGTVTSNCCVRVSVEVIIDSLEMNIYQIKRSWVHGYYDYAAHELAHIRAFSARVKQIVDDRNQLQQPCLKDPSEAISRAKLEAEEIRRLIDQQIDIESDHEGARYTSTSKFGTPATRATYPWGGDSNVGGP